jgi:hypothetical protein
MKIQSTAHRRLLLSAKEYAAVQEKMTKWLDEQKKNGEFETTWAGAGSFVGGGFMNVNSSEELAAVVFG